MALEQRAPQDRWAQLVSLVLLALQVWLGPTVKLEQLGLQV
ncbi:MAG: hypothetical protein Q8M78_09325 [Burkholderiaceae bacterium]|nr:hypothetical protein [Burkholderiaceae bacterium]